MGMEKKKKKEEKRTMKKKEKKKTSAAEAFLISHSWCDYFIILKQIRIIGLLSPVARPANFQTLGG